MTAGASEFPENRAEVRIRSRSFRDRSGGLREGMARLRPDLVIVAFRGRNAES